MQNRRRPRTILTQCFVDVLNRGARELYGEADIGRLVREAECLRYSTTAGTNAVIEHKGTPVAMLVEAGEETTVYGAARTLKRQSLVASDGAHTTGWHRGGGRWQY